MGSPIYFSHVLLMLKKKKKKKKLDYLFFRTSYIWVLLIASHDVS